MGKDNVLLKKIVTSIVAALTIIALLLQLGNSGTLKWFPPPAVFSLVGICFFTSIIYPFIWHWKEKNQETNADFIYARLYFITRYAIAFGLAIFGWKKIFGLQFVVPASISGIPMNQQSGEWLTWYYFGHSFTYGVIISLIQIVGSYLLLFRRTQLAAAVGLFPFMLNLTLINVFYGLNAGALTQSILLTTGIIFLISLEYNRLVEFFFKNQTGIPSISIGNIYKRNIIRFSAIFLALIFTLYLKFLS